MKICHSFLSCLYSLSYFDVIGPEIKFLNIKKTGSRNQTPSGGLISLIVIILSLLVSVYFSIDLIIRTNPLTYQVTRFVDDTPKLTFGQDSLYFAVYYEPSDNNKKEMPKFDERFVTFSANLGFSKNSTTIANYTMRNCNYTRDFKGIEDFFIYDKANIEDIGYCLGDMIKDGKTIPPESPEYIKLYLEHGLHSFEGEPVWVNVVAERCKNTTENGNHCYSKEVMDKYFQLSQYTILLIDNNFDPTNYEQPIQRYVSRINGIMTASTFSDNYLNLNTIYLKTHDGFLFDAAHEIMSYQNYERVEIVSNNALEGELTNTLFTFHFCPQNNVVTYERFYTKIQDVLANIGGVIKTLMLMGQLVNAFFSSYFVKSDLYNNFMTLMRFSSTNQQQELTSFNSSPSIFITKKLEVQQKNSLPLQEDSTLCPILALGQLRKHRPELVELTAPGGDIEKVPQIQSKIKETPKLESSAKIGMVEYYKKSFKSFLSKNADEDLKQYSLCYKLEKEIFNEKTFLQMFFDIKKLKEIFLTKHQRQVFESIKCEFHELKEVKETDLPKLLKILTTSDDKINKILVERLLKEMDKE